MNSTTWPHGGFERQHSSTSLQCTLADGDVQEDLPVARGYSFYWYSLFAPPPYIYKGRGGQPSQGLTN
jgi:hypothetical protein